MPAMINPRNPGTGETITVGSERIAFRVTSDQSGGVLVARAAAALADPTSQEVIAFAAANGIAITRPISEVPR